MNRCCSTAGAWSSACAGVRHGTGTSSRNTLVRPVACEVGGFCLIEAADLDEAVEVAAQHPAATYGTIEVRELWPQ